MRKVMMAVAVVVLAGCNAADGTKPWDQNQDGLVTACEGLNHDTCVATAGCELVATTPLYATDAERAVQGCFAEPTEVCQPTPPPPPPDCSLIPVAMCQFIPACEVVSQQLCTGVRGSDASTPPGMEHGCIPPPDTCEVVEFCVNRAPPSCESLSEDACLAQPGCALEEVFYACTMECRDDGHGGCMPCEAPTGPQARCVTVPPPSCEGVPLDHCALTPGCYVEESAACPAVCEDDGMGGCMPCPVAPPRCLPIAPSCETRSPDECTAMPGCALVQEDYACPAVCEDDGNGGCLPCPQPAPRCVSGGSTVDPDVGTGPDAPPPPRP